MTASAYVFCAALQNALPAAVHSTSTSFPLVQDVRPITADWPALTDTNGTWIYFDAQIQYAYPMYAYWMYYMYSWQCVCKPCRVCWRVSQHAFVKSKVPVDVATSLIGKAVAIISVWIALCTARLRLSICPLAYGH